MSNDTVVIKKSGFLNFVLGLLILVLVVILLLTFFPIGNSRNSSVNDKLEVLTSRIFSENIELMQDTAKEYFTIDKLPKNIGDTAVLTLEEMYEKNLLLELKDSNGKACVDIASYVKVTRLEDKYEMHTTLVCEDDHNTIVNFFDLECGLSCNVCNEEKVAVKTPIITTEKKKNTYTEYRYQKTTYTGFWSDWSNWTTEEKNADDVQTKYQYQGKKLIRDINTLYVHTRTIPGIGSYQSVYTLITPAEEKTCYEKYVVSTYSARDCATCAITTHYVYGTKAYDCSTVAVYGYVNQYVAGTDTVETITTKNSYEEGYTLKDTIIQDNSYYVYTDGWVFTLPNGYTKTNTRSLYRYRYYTETSTTEYTTSTNPNLGDGWTLIGSSVITNG